MRDKINSNYLENYSRIFSEKACAEYFGTKQYISGQEIIQLTPSHQTNLLVIKSLFSRWQEDLEEIKRSPYFDYKDYAVQEALKEFMNVLSRAIKIEKTDFEPLLRQAVRDTILLAADPETFFAAEIAKASPTQVGAHLKNIKRYIKWQLPVFNILLEKAGQGVSVGELNRALTANYDYLKDQLEPPAALLVPLEKVHPIDYKELLHSDEQEEPTREQEVEMDNEAEDQPGNVTDQSATRVEPQATEGGQAIDPALAWAKFESEEYGYMKGSVSSVTESVGINQKIMFTKVLFEGNHDLMMHALKSVDQCDNFVDAIELLNQRYVAELNWEVDSDEVGEFLQLIFRKFDQKE
ncbi:MAG TPA: hypothetical protein VKZ51_11765 [Cyclobacteriaceae bacterium]|nr:hypothetical protein [Cyclobacteriaceae bacterium]